MMRLSRPPAGALEPVHIARGASTGFTVLVLGGLTMPLLAQFVPLAGPVGLTSTAVAAFLVSGARIGRSPVPSAQGAATALAAYLLVLPLMLISGAEITPAQFAATVACALFVGACSGWAAGRRRDRRTPEKVGHS